MTETKSQQSIAKTVTIAAPAAAVWHALTHPQGMQQWMSQTDIQIITDWKVGSPIVIRGNNHGLDFENTGTVLAFEPERKLAYSHLSSISRLPDEPQSYTVLQFELSLADTGTQLVFTADNFPTDSIYHHFAFYWNVALEVLKKTVEENS
jgi:uncharacterized protein YndB with AHSA1/START domain